MSWLIGSVCKAGNPAQYRGIVPSSPIVELHTSKIWLAAGGASPTFLSGTLADGKTYVVLGYPLACDTNGYRHLHKPDLETILLDEANTRALDGRYLILITDGKTICAFNDPLAKRSLFIHEDGDQIFFCSNLKLLKQAVNPAIDFGKLGIYWHSMHPLSKQKYAPTLNSYYHKVRTMGSAAKLMIDSKVHLETRLFLPDQNRQDPIGLIRTAALAPLESGKTIALSISGGFDMRALLAVYLKAGAHIVAFHRGNKEDLDYQIPSQMAARFGFKIQNISYQETEWQDSWAQILDWMSASLITMNPMNAAYKQYTQMIATEADTMVSGCFGELLRFRLYAAHMASLISLGKVTVSDFSKQLHNYTPCIFQPEICSQLSEGFERDLREACSQMPPSQQMNNPKWMNLFHLRYTNFTKVMPQVAELDSVLLDFMPWLQSRALSQHWNYSTAYQLNESVHRGLVAQDCPALKQYPLVLANITAPYHNRQYQVKLKYWLANRNGVVRQHSTDIFLQRYKSQIHDLMASTKVRTYAPYDLARLDKSFDEYHRGMLHHRDTLLSWLAFELGR